MKFRDKVWVYISLLTLITALVWFGVSLHAALQKPTIPAGVEALITPLTPDLDMTVLNNLKTRSNQSF